MRPLSREATSRSVSGRRYGEHVPEDPEDCPPTTGEWGALLSQPAREVRHLERALVPVQPGVYLWRRRGVAVYVGTASSLQGRLWSKHLGAGLSLAGSSLRRNVCELLFGIPPTVTSNPDREKVTKPQAEAIRAWLLDCDLAWQTCETPAEAGLLETRLRAAYMPPLNRI